MIALILFICCALFFGLVSKESGVPRWAWITISIGTWLLGEFIFQMFTTIPPMFGGLSAQMVLFAILCIHWAAKPRRTSKERFGSLTGQGPDAQPDIDTGLQTKAKTALHPKYKLE